MGPREAVSNQLVSRFLRICETCFWDAIHDVGAWYTMLQGASLMLRQQRHITLTELAPLSALCSCRPSHVLACLYTYTDPTKHLSDYYYMCWACKSAWESQAYLVYEMHYSLKWPSIVCKSLLSHGLLYLTQTETRSCCSSRHQEHCM